VTFDVASLVLIEKETIDTPVKRGGKHMGVSAQLPL
jgi:hypothetical protein